MRQSPQQRYSFNEFTVDLGRACLLREGHEVKLRPKSFEAFKYLVENRGRLVTKEELIQTLWPDSFVTDDSLVKCLRDVRLALGDDSHHYIKTVPRRGYIFDAEVIRHDATARDVVFKEEVELRKIAIEEEIEEETRGSAPTGEKRQIIQSADEPLRRTRPAHPTRSAILATLIAVIAGAIALIAYRYIGGPTESQLPIRSIAVLPLKNLSDDHAQEYFSDGVTESLITALSRIESLKVISRGSVFRFKGKEVDPRDVGKQLGVASVLEGTVRKEGTSVRVAVRLVSAEDGGVLWASPSYDRALADIFTLQDEIARSVAAGLRVKLTGDGEQRLARRHTADVEAYQLYLIGKHHLNKRTAAGFQRGIEYFEQAVARDPNYALAYSGLADCHALLSPHGIQMAKDGHLKAKAAAAKALEIDDRLAEAHTSLANIIFLYEWDWLKAEKQFKQAIELNPNHPTSHQWYSTYLSSMGRHEEAIREGKRALELDPLSLPIIRDLARCFYHARRYDETITQYLKTFELEPKHHRLNSWLELAYEQKGLYDQAFDLRLKAMNVIGFTPESIKAREKAYAKSGWLGAWRKELELSEDWVRQNQSYVNPYYRARIYQRLGEKERALEWLEKAYGERSDHLVLLKVDPIFDELRTDPRFADLLRRIGFTS